MDNDDLLNIEEVAETLGVSKRTVRWYKQLDRLHAFPHTHDLKFHKTSVEKLKYCFNGEIKLSRRPATVLFDSLRKPPTNISWVGTIEKPSDTYEVKVEYFHYYSVYEDNDIQKLIETSVANGWLKDGYRTIELSDPDGNNTKIIGIGEQNYVLPPYARVSHYRMEITKPLLDENKLIIQPKNIYIEELKETINACPPFIIFYYYDIIDNQIKFVRQYMKGHPVY